jgi:hypothetical protein
MSGYRTRSSRVCGPTRKVLTVRVTAIAGRLAMHAITATARAAIFQRRGMDGMGPERWRR